MHNPNGSAEGGVALGVLPVAACLFELGRHVPLAFGVPWAARAGQRRALLFDVGDKLTPRRLAAAGIAAALVVLVALDLTAHSFSGWWDRHTLSASIVANLLVLGFAGLVVDEVVARRQREDRANSVAVQAIIVYDQAQRTYASVLAILDAQSEPRREASDEPGSETPDEPDSDAPDELRALANMLLTSSPSLFDDPEARIFLENVQRLTGVMFRASSASLVGHPGRPSRELLATAMDRLHASARPLVERLSAGYRAAIDELDPNAIIAEPPVGPATATASEPPPASQ